MDQESRWYSMSKRLYPFIKIRISLPPHSLFFNPQKGPRPPLPPPTTSSPVIEPPGHLQAGRVHPHVVTEGHKQKLREALDRREDDLPGHTLVAWQSCHLASMGWRIFLMSWARLVEASWQNMASLNMSSRTGAGKGPLVWLGGN